MLSRLTCADKEDVSLAMVTPCPRSGGLVVRQGLLTDNHASSPADMSGASVKSRHCFDFCRDDAAQTARLNFINLDTFFDRATAAIALNASTNNWYLDCDGEGTHSSRCS